MGRMIVIALALLALAPAEASAQRCVAPPGTAAVDQYCETVPTASGDRESGAASSGGGPVPVSRATAAALAKAGKDGAALSRVLGRDPSKPHEAVKGKRASRAAAGTAAAPAAPSSNPLTAVKQSLASGATVGSGFVWALLLATIATLAWVWIGFRRRRTD